MTGQKIAIISDIKGNMIALNTFLEYINKDPQIEYVCNLGNFIGCDKFSHEVFDIITSDFRFIN